jgi:hypothetical protein
MNDERITGKCLFSLPEPDPVSISYYFSCLDELESGLAWVVIWESEITEVCCM